MICDIMFIGHVSIDQIENQNGMRVQPGGAALYAAVAAKTLLDDVSLVSAIGTDYKFKDYLELLRSDYIRPFNLPSTRFNIKYNEDWEAEYLKAVYGVGSKITASVIPTQILGPGTFVHISPMRPVQVRKIVKKIREDSYKTQISINTCIDYIIKSQKNRQILEDLALQVDFFILNDREAKSLANKDSILTALTILKAKRLIITLGELGAIFREENREIQLIPGLNVPSARIIDTTGAGDVWCGSFSAAYKLTNDLMKSVTFASILSGIKCSGWNFQKLLKLKFRKPEGAMEYVLGLKEGLIQKRITDYAKENRTSL